MTRLWHIAWSTYCLKWSLVRLGLAVFALWVVAADTEARLARSALRMMTDVDLAAEVRDLRQKGRFGEAISVSEQALTDESLPPTARDALRQEHDLAVAEHAS